MEIPDEALMAAAQAFKDSDAVSLYYDEYHVDNRDKDVASLVRDVVEAALAALPRDWATRATNGVVFRCRDEKHARGMVTSKSPVLGPWEDREVVSRPRLDWEASDAG